jgi:hypothetical protein
MYDVMSTFYISIPGPLNFQILHKILHKSAVDYPESHTIITECNINTRAAQRSKALHLSATGVTTVQIQAVS